MSNARGRLARGEFKRQHLNEFEERDICNTFGAHLWLEASPGRWLEAGTERLVEDVDIVIGDGKEATVHRCVADSHVGFEWAVAKVYRAQKFRAFSNASKYLHGKRLRDKRSQRAIEGKTRRGREIAHRMWIEREWETMVRLWDAGADVPQPYARTTDSILMEYVGDASSPAPLLLRVKLAGPELKLAFERLLHNVELLLSCDRVHGDLSAYNVLWWQGQPMIIDMPQSVEASSGPDAYELLRRDIANLCSYFERRGLQCDATKIAASLWNRWLAGKL